MSERTGELTSESLSAAPDRQARMWQGGRRRRGKGREGGEQPTVPPVEFRDYYGIPVVKAATWKHDIPAYLFTGGLAGGSSLLAVGGQLTGQSALRVAGRVTSLGALLASTYFLINDLGRPGRFLNMLRVAKPTSPMSMGTWVLAVYGPMAGVAAVSEAAPFLPKRGALGVARRVLPPVGSATGVVSAVAAPALASYTAVLIADTATPSWHEVYRDLPFVFVGSALVSGAGVGLIAAPVKQQGPARRMALLGSVIELVAEYRVETRYGLLSEPYHEGKAGRLLRASQVLTVAGVAGALLGRGNRLASGLSGAALLAGSLATRFGVFEAGMHSARDPKYTVIPQRQRLREKALQNGHRPTTSSDQESLAGRS